MNIKTLTTRTISGLIYIIIIIGSIFIGDYGVYILAGLLSLLGCLELYKITHKEEIPDYPVLFIDIAATLCLTWMPLGFPLIIFLILLLLRLIMELYVNGPHPLKNTALSLLTYGYIGLPLGCMLFIPFMRFSTLPLLAIFILIWLNDTGAFLVGSLFGRHRLFERISPKKSWEGFFGGFIFDMIVAAVFGLFCPSFFKLDFGLGFWIGFGALISIFSTFGDLFESMIKRNLNIKDSGSLIPGHGGILDRIDSLLFVMPASMIYILIFELCIFDKSFGMI